MTQAVAIFCEDIREEASGQVTLVGVFADNLEVPAVPGLMPKLCLYVRVHLDIGHKPSRITSVLTDIDGSEIPLGGMEGGGLDSAFEEAESFGVPYVGVILRGIFSPFRVNATGRAVALVRVDDEEVACGSINFVLPKS